MWIADHHFKQPLSKGVASERRDRVRVAGSSVGTVREKSILHRSHKLVGNTRAVVAKNAKSLQAIIVAGELAEDFCEKHSLCRRQIAIREFDQFILECLVFHGAFGQESRQEVAVPMVGDEFWIEQFRVRVHERQQYFARSRTLKRPSPPAA